MKSKTSFVLSAFYILLKAVDAVQIEDCENGNNVNIEINFNVHVKQPVQSPSPDSMDDTVEAMAMMEDQTAEVDSEESEEQNEPDVESEEPEEQNEPDVESEESEEQNEPDNDSEEPEVQVTEPEIACEMLTIPTDYGEEITVCLDDFINVID